MPSGRAREPLLHPVEADALERAATRAYELLDKVSVEAENHSDPVSITPSVSRAPQTTLFKSLRSAPLTLLSALHRRASVRRCSNRSHMSFTRGAVSEAQDCDLPGDDFRWPEDRCKAARYRNSLGAVLGIGDHTAPDCAADLLTPQPLTVGNIQGIEVAAHVSEEDDASRRRGHAAQDRVIGL